MRWEIHRESVVEISHRWQPDESCEEHVNDEMITLRAASRSWNPGYGAIRNNISHKHTAKLKASDFSLYSCFKMASGLILATRDVTICVQSSPFEGTNAGI